MKGYKFFDVFFFQLSTINFFSEAMFLLFVITNTAKQIHRSAKKPVRVLNLGNGLYIDDNRKNVFYCFCRWDDCVSERNRAVLAAFTRACSLVQS